MQPQIAVTPCRALPDYLESVKIAGGTPRALDRTVEPADSVLSWCHGLLLTGGGDVDPGRYGETAHPAVAGVDRERDQYEFDLVTKAIERDIPVLAICRGAQVLNVAGGGTLVQDIPTQVQGAESHDLKNPLSGIAHEIWVSKDSLLWTLLREQALEADSCDVNSRHHQAIKSVAAGFEVCATSPDGIIEAIERTSSGFCLGVQWHPENFWRTGEFRPLFEGFIGACRRLLERLEQGSTT